MLKCFGDLIGQTIDAYMDDIMVKSKWVDQVIADLEQTFKKLRANDIKLNPEKCVFRVPRGMCWVSSSPIVASKPTRRRSRPS